MNILLLVTRSFEDYRRQLLRSAGCKTEAPKTKRTDAPPSFDTGDEALDGKTLLPDSVLRLMHSAMNACSVRPTTVRRYDYKHPQFWEVIVSTWLQYRETKRDRILGLIMAQTATSDEERRTWAWAALRSSLSDNRGKAAPPCIYDLEMDCRVDHDIQYLLRGILMRYWVVYCICGEPSL
jgi:hypothetical protein